PAGPGIASAPVFTPPAARSPSHITGLPAPSFTTARVTASRKRTLRRTVFTLGLAPATVWSGQPLPFSLPPTVKPIWGGNSRQPPRSEIDATSDTASARSTANPRFMAGTLHSRVHEGQFSVGEPRLTVLAATRYSASFN